MATVAVFALVSTAAFAEPYTRLFRIMMPKGDCQVKKPGATLFEPAIKGKAYPYGSMVSCGVDSTAIILFTEADAVRILDNSSAQINLNSDGVRLVSLQSGAVVTRVNASATNDVVIIESPLGIAKSIVGNCKVALTDIPATETSPAKRMLEVRSETLSNMRFVGNHFFIPFLKNGNCATITTLLDGSSYELADVVGDYAVNINTGINPDPIGDTSENPEIQAIKMSTKSSIKFWRERAPIGGRMIVSVLVTDSAGKGCESFAFAVGQSNLAARSSMILDAIATNELDVAVTEGLAENPSTDENSFGGESFGDEATSFEDDSSVSGGFEEEQAPAAEAVSDDAGLYDFLF